MKHDEESKVKEKKRSGLKKRELRNSKKKKKTIKYNDTHLMRMTATVTKTAIVTTK